MDSIRISVNLTHYYYDYRQLARLCLTNQFKTISDLQNYIAETFNLECGFYLCWENHYLPPGEDIRVLNNNDLIYVKPTDQENNSLKKNKKKQRKGNDQLSISPDQSKKSKRSNSQDEEAIDEIDINSLSNICTRKKRPYIAESQYMSATEMDTDTLEKKALKLTQENNNEPMTSGFLNENFSQLTVSSGNSVKECPTNTPHTLMHLSGVGSVIDALRMTPETKDFVSKRRRVRKRRGRKEFSELQSLGFSTNTQTVIPPEDDRIEEKQVDYDASNSQFNCIDLKGLPKQNDLILFKRLKIGEGYTPEISNQILAKVKTVKPNNLYLEILDGLEEFKTPEGMLTLPVDELDNMSEFINIDPTLLIDTKLLINYL